VRLFVNGMFRKVVVDDQVPVGRDGRLLVSISNTKDMWVTLLEKAYAKVLGGYDAMDNGGDSSADLHLLFSWIPERLDGRDCVDAWDKIHKAHVDGLCVITLASHGLGAAAAGAGPLAAVPEELAAADASAEAARTGAAALGLVPGHSYAVLTTRHVRGHRLVEVKNPWAQRRWKGRFSEQDKASWTPELRADLGYDPESNSQFDNGVFWMEWSDVCAYFRTVDLAWRPSAFPHQRDRHGVWHARSMGGTISSEDYGSNPQFVLEIDAPPAGSEVFLLLSRHLGPKEPAFIALHVFDVDPREPFPRVVVPDEAPKLLGAYTDSQHFSARLPVPPGRHRFVVVASQSTKETAYFSLHGYAKDPFSLVPAPAEVRSNRVTVLGSFNVNAAGGSALHPTFWLNPMYRLTVPERIRILAELCLEVTPPQPAHNVALHLVAGGARVDRLTQRNVVLCSGKYRRKKCAMFAFLEPGVYTLVASTFSPGQQGNYAIRLASEPARVTVDPLPFPWEDRPFVTPIESSFASGRDGGSRGFGKYAANPSYAFSSELQGCVSIRLQVRPAVPGSEPAGAGPQEPYLRPAINLRVFQVPSGGGSGASDPALTPHLVTSEGYIDIPCGVSVEVETVPSVTYLAICSTYHPGQHCDFSLTFYSDVELKISQRR
jgi:calpain-7